MLGMEVLIALLCILLVDHEMLTKRILGIDRLDKLGFHHFHRVEIVDRELIHVALALGVMSRLLSLILQSLVCLRSIHNV